MRLDLLFHHAADLGIDVEWADMDERTHGLYRDADNLIVLNRRLTQAQAVSALAHELAHWLYRDYCSTPANERRASEWAAALVISTDEYRAAETLVGCHPGALARELGVTRHLVLAWRRWYSRKHGVVSGPSESVEPC